MSHGHRSRLLKVEAAGNDFLLAVGEWAARLAADQALVRRLCDRHRGLGADGSLSLFAESQTRLRLVYRNSDGGVARFCANGTRCAARAGVELLGLATELIVATDWAEIAAQVSGDMVSLSLPPPAGSPTKLVLATTEGNWQAQFLSLGVPHLVIEVQDLEQLDVKRAAPALRGHPELGPEGANVNFVDHRAGKPLAIRSFERGIEAETLCCGSGVAAAGLLALADRGASSIEVKARSGDILQVEALGQPPGCASRLTGPARFVAEVEPSAELLEG